MYLKQPVKVLTAGALRPHGAARTPCPKCKGTGHLAASPLAVLRRHWKLGQAVVAAVIGKSQAAYCRLEARGAASWSRHAGTLAAFYGVTTDQIAGRAPLPKLATLKKPTLAPAKKKGAWGNGLPRRRRL